MSSLYLNPATWDLVADLNGNIALAAAPYATAQDVACAVKLYLGELYYDTTQGVAWGNVYAKLPPISYVRAQIVAAALTVVGVIAAKVFFTSFSHRAISGQVQFITSTSSVPATVGF